MTDINKQIEEEANSETVTYNWKHELFAYMQDEHDVTMLDSDMHEVFDICKKEFEHSSRWRKVSEEMPESYDSLLDSDIPDVECTRYVLVRTRDGHIYENRRLRMAIGNKEWVWAMSVEGDTDFTEWKPID